MVLNYKKPGFWVTILALIAALAVGVCLLTTPRTDLERCERALKQWQELDAWQFHESQSNVGELAENEWSVVNFWSSEEEHLMRLSYAEDGGFWKQWKDGKTYVRDFASSDAEAEDLGWQETQFQEKEIIPWVMRLDWEELTIHHWEAVEDGKTILLNVDFPTLGPGTLGFFFDDEVLRSVSRSFTQPSSTVITGTIELVETEQETIEQEMEHFGIAPELVQLYSQLEALQNSEGVHLVIDMEIDSDYPGWKTCRQEFLRSGDRFYRNYDYQSAAGPYTATYLQYGNAVYAREYSEAGVVPNREWERIQDRGFGELPLLNQDWTRFAVLGIEQLTDGSAVITMQGNLDSTSDTTYYEKTYEFHLDTKGKLTKQIGTYHASKIISDGFAQGTFEVRGTDTVHILETPQEELTKRILEEVMELLGYKAAAQKSGG